MKFAFFQDWGSYTNQTLVCVGMTRKEILAFAKSHEIKKEYIKNILKRLPKREAKGSVWFHKGATLLRLKDFADTWDDELTLVHETHHMVQFGLVRSKKFGPEEMEGLAYQQEYLFDHIMRKLIHRHRKDVKPVKSAKKGKK